MALTVVLEVVYDASAEEEARALAYRDAGRLFQQPYVLEVSADLKRPRDLPITEMYLDGQMDVYECIEEAEHA